jgi:CubicO group peptidase (beta-lactamase class C family)
VAAANAAASASSPASDDVTAPVAALLDRADLEAWLDGFLPYALQRGDIAGAVVLVIKDGRILLQKGYGYADVARQIRMDPQETIIGVGSVSKLFAWTAAMQQVERGKLELDRDINDYLDFKIPPAFDKPITLRHLMTHTAGFEERTFRQASEGSQPRALRDYLRGVPVPDRIYPPGEVPAYSNYGSMLAGYLVERVSGEPFVTHIERHILAPLGMSHSTFRRPIPEGLRADLAKDYGVASGEVKPPNNEEPAGDPSGHLITTANDISRFMLAHLQQGRYAEYQLLRPQTTQLMHAPAFVAVPGAQSVALGFFGMDYNDRRVITHMGDISGFHADVELLPDEGVGFFMAVNSDGTSRNVLESANGLRASLFRQFMDRYFPARHIEESTATTAKEHAQLAAGEYRMSRRHAGDFMEAINSIAEFFVVSVEIVANDDGTIETPGWMSFENGRPQTWHEVGPFVWREVGGRARLNMKVENGRVTAFFPSDVLPAWLNERVPFVWSRALHVPLLLAALAVLLVATLLWPVAVAVRRRYGRSLELPADEARGDRFTRLAALIGTLFALGWVVLMIAGAPSEMGFEPWIRLVQVIGLLCVAGAAVAVWNAWLTCTRRRSAWARIWSVVLALALLELVWFSFAFNLISATLNY